MSIFRRRLMMGEKKPIEYLEFEDRRVWEICAYRWGYTQNIQEIGGAGGVLDEGVINGNNDTIVYCDHIFAASYAIGAHGSVPATAARTVQYRVEIVVEGGRVLDGENAPWDIATASATGNAIFYPVQYGTTMSATALGTITAENWADPTFWASQTILTDGGAVGANAHKYTALITTTKACQYLRLGIRAVAGTKISYKFVSVGVTKKPLGISAKQCAAVSSLGTVFQGNTILASSRDMVHFTGVTILGKAFTSSLLLKIFCPPRLEKTNEIYTFEVGSGSAIVTVFLPRTFKGFGQANQFRYRKGTIICLNTQPDAVSVYNPASNSTYNKLYVPDESVELYKSTIGWKYFSSIVGISTLPVDLASELEWYEQF